MRKTWHYRLTREDALELAKAANAPRPAPASGDSGCGKAVIEPWSASGGLIERDAAIVALFEADLPYSANEELDKIAARLRALPSVRVTEEQIHKANDDYVKGYAAGQRMMASVSITEEQIKELIAALTPFSLPSHGDFGERADWLRPAMYFALADYKRARAILAELGIKNS